MAHYLEAITWSHNVELPFYGECSCNIARERVIIIPDSLPAMLLA